MTQRSREETAQESFFALGERLQAEIRVDETLFCELEAEHSEFVRLNANRIRQAGQIQRSRLRVRLIEPARQAEAQCDLNGDLARDFDRARALLRQLRQRLRHLPEDPWLTFSTESSVSNRWPGVPMVETDAAVQDILSAAEGLDLVGLWSSGELTSGLMSSLGHRHWHVSRGFQFDWSCHGSADRAVKGQQAGVRWNPAPVRARLADMRAELELLAHPRKTLAPGRYRAWLAPMAMAELIEMLAWDAFDLKNQRTRQTPLLQLLDGERQFAPQFTLSERHGEAGTGLLPSFTSEGFVRPDVVTLIDRGRPGMPLVDARASREYGQPVNAASGTPESLVLEPGELTADQQLAELGTGLLIGNLWYGNWSDPNSARVTGMTRFGTYWVENGALVAPVAPMRFDDSLYQLFGERLLALGAEAPLLMSTDSYDGCSYQSLRVPGALVEGLTLTL